jgi:hypothetical protein
VEERPTIELQENVLCVLCFGTDRHSDDIVARVKPEHFDGGKYRDIATRALDYRATYGEPPGEGHTGDLFDHVLDGPNATQAESYRNTLKWLFKLAEKLNTRFVADHFGEFIKRQQAKALLFGLFERWQKNAPVDEFIAHLQTGASQLAMMSPEPVPIGIISFTSLLRTALSPPREAFRRLAGDVVRTYEPCTEGDPMALLVQFLTMFGNCVGRGPCFRLGTLTFRTNMFTVIVGDTALSRKGTAFDVARDLFVGVDDAWLDRIMGGLSSGEGLVWAVRQRRDDKRHDERLMVFATEFASVLINMARQGNNLSTVLRDAWDGRPLRILTKNDPASAPVSHISMIAHITVEELRKYFDQTEMASGFGNRFLFSAARRSKVLAIPEAPDRERVKGLKDRLYDAIEFARDCADLSWTREAVQLWTAIYEEEATKAVPGLVGHLLARSTAHILRLATIYALLDKTARIDTCHLRAALAVWRYAEASARAIFGAALGDPVADLILRTLREAGTKGMTRTDISEALGRNSPSWHIHRALETLHGYGLIEGERHPTGRPGRPIEVWRAVAVEAADKGERAVRINELNEISARGSPPRVASRANGDPTNGSRR